MMTGKKPNISVEVKGMKVYPLYLVYRENRK